MKLSIKTELIYCYSDETQVIANLEASHTRDQKISQNRWTFNRLQECLQIRRRMAIADYEPRFRAR